MAELGWDTIRHALRVARERGFGEIDIESAGAKFHASLEPAPAQSLAHAIVAQIPNGELSVEPGTLEVVAPCVGYFQEARTPLLAGARVSTGDVVASITALGLANDVESPSDGEIVEVLAQPGDAVEFGQPLARIRIDV